LKINSPIRNLYFLFFGAAAKLPRRKKDAVSMAGIWSSNVNPEFV
jgi:hypothetical protein